jgi:hypothetical protein
MPGSCRVDSESPSTLTLTRRTHGALLRIDPGRSRVGMGNASELGLLGVTVTGVFTNAAFTRAPRRSTPLMGNASNLPVLTRPEILTWQASSGVAGCLGLS